MSHLNFLFLFRIRLERSVPDRIQSHANCPASLNVFFFFLKRLFLKIFMDQRRLFICLTFWGLIVSRFYFCWFYVAGWSYFKQTVFSGSDMLVTLTIRTLVRKLTIQKDTGTFVKLYRFFTILKICCPKLFLIQIWDLHSYLKFFSRT